MEVACAPHQAFTQGGLGAVELAEKTVALADGSNHQEPRFLYPLEAPVEEKIERLATTIYGADGIYLEKQAQQQIDRLTALGYGDLPICIAKTQASLSDDRTARGVPTGWDLTVTDVQLSAGAGFLVVVCGNMMLMPGLSSRPAAVDMDVDEAGQITGLF